VVGAPAREYISGRLERPLILLRSATEVVAPCRLTHCFPDSYATVTAGVGFLSGLEPFRSPFTRYAPKNA